MTPEEFLDAVRAELADLPDDDRTDLLEDVEQHLAEAAAEGVHADLGSPAAYAAELRAAAGLPPGPDEDAVARWAPVRAAHRLATRVAGTRSYREVRAFAPELRPAWWVARGYLLVVLLARTTHPSLRQAVPIPNVSGNAFLGLLATVGAVVGSVAWGRRRHRLPGWQRTAVVAANVVAAVCALTVVNDLAHRTGEYVYYVNSGPGSMQGPYGTISDIYAFDEDGNPLDGVTLLDQDGRLLAPQICDTYCPSPMTFPLRGREPSPPGETFATPTPSPVPTPSATPTPKPTPKATRPKK
jgi:hypothetical protein